MFENRYLRKFFLLFIIILFGIIVFKVLSHFLYDREIVKQEKKLAFYNDSEKFKEKLHELSVNPSLAIKEIMTQPEENRWILFYHFGQDIGGMYGIDFKAIKEIEELIPSKYHWDYYDGVGDGINWADLLKSPTELVDIVQNEIKIVEFQSVLKIGIILKFVISFDADLVEIRRLISELNSVTTLKERQVGLSVGIMRVYMDNPLEATPVINQLDNIYKKSCFEELGWWIGDQYQNNLTRAVESISKIPEEFRCSAFHGWIRGVEVFNNLAEMANSILKVVPEEYHECCCRAISWKASKRFVDREMEAQIQLKAIKNKDCREWALSQISGGKY